MENIRTDSWRAERRVPALLDGKSLVQTELEPRVPLFTKVLLENPFTS